MDIDKYIGLPYDEENFDCADLVMRVQAEMFGRLVTLPGSRLRGDRGQVVLSGLAKTVVAGIADTPVDGDLVLMQEMGHKRPGHVGVFFSIPGYGDHVLHTTKKSGGSILTRWRDLPNFNLRIEGVYSWK